MTGYGTVLKDIKDNLKSTVKQASSFSTHTYADYIRGGSKGEANPIALIRVRRDRLEGLGPKETRNLATFEIWIEYIGTHLESTLDDVISYTGEIVDVIEANRTLGSSYVSNTEVADIDFSFRESGSAVKHIVKITVEVEYLRNV
ncbi:MAG: hypothetical protein ACTSVD_10655, partial [Candidatus Thorarchaeota archaeon]